MIKGTYIAEKYDIHVGDKAYVGEFDGFNASEHPFDSSTAEQIAAMCKDLVYRFTDEGKLLMSSRFLEKRNNVVWTSAGDEYFRDMYTTYKTDGSTVITVDHTGKETEFGIFTDEVLTMRNTTDGNFAMITFKKVAD